MATIAAHLGVDALRERYVSSSNAREARHFHAIWLLAKGHTLGDVAEMTSFGQRWIEQLAARYNAEGPESLGDLRRRNGSSARVLKPELLDKLRLRLKEPPDDGGLWTSGKVAAFLARELGLEKVAAQRGWEALKACGMSIQGKRTPGTVHSVCLKFQGMSASMFLLGHRSAIRSRVCWAQA